MRWKVAAAPEDINRMAEAAMKAACRVKPPEITGMALVLVTRDKTNETALAGVATVADPVAVVDAAIEALTGYRGRLVGRGN